MGNEKADQSSWNKLRMQDLWAKESDHVLTMPASMQYDHPAVPKGIPRGRVTASNLRRRQINGNRGWQTIGHWWGPS